jgi:hypothetical protein
LQGVGDADALHQQVAALDAKKPQRHLISTDQKILKKTIAGPWQTPTRCASKSQR